PLRARFAVGCDGARSVVREALGIPFEGERYERHKLVQADARLRAGFPLSGGEARFWLRPDGFLGALPLPAGTARLFALVPDADPSDDRDPTLPEMQALLREITGDPVLELSDPRWLSHTRFQHRRAARFREGPCFLAGDAARIVPPILGQGMNTGMQDASNLGWKLAYVARGRARETLLDSYAAEREAVADLVIERTDSAYRHLSDASGLQQALARTLGPRLAATDTLQQRVRDQLFGLAYRYPSASTAVGDGGGERAPDAVAVDRELRPTNVHALLEDGAYTALAFRGGEPDPDGASALRARPGLRVVEVLRRPPAPDDLRRDVLADRDGLIHDRFGAAAGDLVLVRPDGYVALRTRRPAAVDQHLDTVLAS
ncbi:MAG TPA: FAD-dependent monooxygenase, partial [Solirubrobacteraceae bacterium]|nr:FAD-dependent monooxygenase [Solirubrobacteraceae bacterium]